MKKHHGDHVMVACPDRISAGRRQCVLIAIVCLLAPGSLASAQSPTAVDSVRDSIAYLSAAMDQFHSTFPVYADVSSAGNHFHAYAKIPDENAPVTVNGSWVDLPHTGATAIRAEFVVEPGSADFGGFYFQNGILTGTVPQPNFGDVPNAGVNLSGATALTFWARGQSGNERVEFFVAGVGRDAATGAPTSSYPDSSPRRPAVGPDTPGEDGDIGFLATDVSITAADNADHPADTLFPTTDTRRMPPRRSR